MKLSIVIPVYNEEATIEAIIGKVKAVVLPDGLTREIIIVNDGSKDRTADKLAAYSGQKDVLIIHQSNQGKTGALLTGFKNATGDILLIQDADMEYDPKDYPQLVGPILEGRSEVVYGSRFLGRIEKMQSVNRWANGVSNWAINLLYGASMTDINTCYKVFTRRAFEGITIEGKNFGLDTEITIKFLRKGYTIKEVPIDYVARTREEGKKMKWSTALEMFWPIIKYRFIS